jgi:hypothetical protein
MAVDFDQTTRCYIPEDSTHHRLRLFEWGISGQKRNEMIGCVKIVE